MPSAYYAVCPGTGGTDDKKTGSPTITIASGVATLSVAQTGNIGQGFRITYDTSKVCFISKVNSSTSFDVVTATGGTPSNEASAVTVNSIAADYASLSDAESGASDSAHLNTSDLVTATTILNLVCYAGASADTTACTISGYTTSVDYYINVYVANGGTQSISSNRHLGVWDSSKYSITSNASGVNTIQIADQYVHIFGLQVYNDDSSYNSSAIHVYEATAADPSCTIDSCILRADCTNNTGYTDGGVVCFGYASNTSNYCYIKNSIIYGASGTYGAGVNVADYNVGVKIYNCTIFGNTIGVCASRNSGIDIVVVNCAVFNNTDDFYDAGATGTFTVNYTASDDNDISGTGNIDLADSASSWNAQFADYDATNPDVSLVGNSLLIGEGTDLSAYFTTDIAGTTRSSWDIGAFEYVSGGSGPKWNTITPAKWNGVDWSNLKWNGM